MHTVARVEIPRPVRRELETAADFVEDLLVFARRRLLTTTTATLVAALALATIFIFGAWRLDGPAAGMRCGIVFFLGWSASAAFAAAAGWRKVVEEYEGEKTRCAAASRDLSAGYGEHNALELIRPPRYFEHEHGVIVLADAGFCETLYFNIPHDDGDPRWDLYRDGGLNQRSWRWLRLPKSRSVVEFLSAGARLASRDETMFIDAPEPWEAVGYALGNPSDGQTLRMAFDDAVSAVERAL